jgi:FtsP/CotA-like multicopper oxidase with cupredoxin domain
LGAAGWAAGRKAWAQERTDSARVDVHTPHLAKLPHRMDGGVKVFELVAQVVKREFLPGKVVDVWGFNGSMPGPTIEVTEGDRVRILFRNELPEVTTPHWHGLEVPIEMDGVPAISQPLVEPGGSYTYEFTLHQHGTFFYHSHMAMQQMMGMLGMFIVHPRVPYRPAVQKDFGLILQEWAILPNNSVPNSLSMEFNWLTMNGKAGPAISPLIVKLGERVRIRFVNIGMDHHPMHLHGNTFVVTGTEGGRIPETQWFPGNTVLVGVAQARNVEFEAARPGDWMLHCHLPHHMMNAMVSMVGPMAHAGHGIPAGLGMEEGMGMVRGDHALSEHLGPSLGRATGLATAENRVSNAVGPQGAPAGQPATPPEVHVHEAPPKAERRVPGFPQDMWMTMDDAVARPETHGMAPGWTGAMMGMMTVVRVLPPDRYADIMARVKSAGLEPPPAEHHPGGAPGHVHK